MCSKQGLPDSSSDLWYLLYTWRKILAGENFGEFWHIECYSPIFYTIKIFDSFVDKNLAMLPCISMALMKFFQAEFLINLKPTSNR